ncbi:MAG: AbrB/MazE/SpoVT family DNA-binding domain-containing protein [Propionibacteriaceae bacterium]|jgi:AbrB family looped-hinge helix DNA binding protein|nr:AbrB/MazE/SpoVT family DNA-binding domain-containing protein [Propionibacteriaceae bacterium]
MATTLLSSRGQIVIPVDVRTALGWKAGDKVTVEVSQDNTEVHLRKKETLDAMAERLSRYVLSGTPPLMDVHDFYEHREARG